MRFRFILSEVASGLRRNLSMAVSVILVTFVSLTFVGAAGLLQAQIGKMKDEWYGKVEVSIFLCPKDSTEPNCAGGEVTEDQTRSLAQSLESSEMAPYVEKVNFETKEMAYKSFEQRFGHSDLFGDLSVDDMQESFRVKLVDPTQYQILNEAYTGRPGVEQVVDQRELLEPLFKLLNQLTLLALAVAGVMLVAAILLITTTIRLSALSRRRETGIMRLVGASNLFVQLPFMLEGAIAATIGSLLAVGALWGAVHYVQDDLAQSTALLGYLETADVWRIAPFLVIAAVALAAVSSLVTLSRYTKV